MSIIDSLPDNYNILSPISFRLQIDRLPNVTYFLQTANLPGLTVSESTVPTPTRAYPIAGSILEFDAMDCSFVVDEDLKNYREIITWLRAMAPPAGNEDLIKLRSTSNNVMGLYSDASLTILTNSMNANKSVVFKDIFPISLSALSFESAADSVEPITADVSFQFTDYIIEDVT